MSLCARVSVRVSVQGRARAGGGRAPGLPSSPARSSRSLANSGPEPRAGARRKDSMLSLLVWILTLSDTFSQGKLPHPPLRPRQPLLPPPDPRGGSVRPHPGRAEGLGRPRPVPGGRDATRWGLGPRAEYRGLARRSFPLICPSCFLWLRGRTENRGREGWGSEWKRDPTAQSLFRSLWQLYSPPPSETRSPDAWVPAGGRLGRGWDLRFGGRRCAESGGPRLPKMSGGNPGPPSAQPLAGLSPSRGSRLPGAAPSRGREGCLGASGGDLNPCPRRLPVGSGVPKAASGPLGMEVATCGGGGSGGRLTPSWVRKVPMLGLYLGPAGKSLGDGGEVDR